MSEKILPIFLIIISTLAAAIIHPSTSPIRNVSATPVSISAPQVTSFVLFADFNGWNNTRPSGKNPTIVVLSNSTLRIGTPPAPPSFKVTIRWVNVIHDFAIDDQLGNRIGTTAQVDSSHPTASATFAMQTGVYTYYCEFHPLSMVGTIKAINPDVTHDGAVSLDDLIQTYLHEFLSDLNYDVNLDGAVSLDDLIIVYLDQFIS